MLQYFISVFPSRLSIVRFILSENHTEVISSTVINCRWFEMFVHCKCWQVPNFVISIGLAIFYVEYHYTCMSWLARWYSNHSNMIQIHMSRNFSLHFGDEYEYYGVLMLLFVCVCVCVHYVAHHLQPNCMESCINGNVSLSLPLSYFLIAFNELVLSSLCVHSFHSFHLRRLHTHTHTKTLQRNKTENVWQASNLVHVYRCI